MQKKKSALAVVLISFSIFSLSSISVSAASTVVQKGMKGTRVVTLQKDLKNLGFMSMNPTGYFGRITEKAVIKLQSKNGVKKDGVVGRKTAKVIDNLLERTADTGKTGSSAQKTVSASNAGSSVKKTASTSKTVSLAQTTSSTEKTSDSEEMVVQVQPQTNVSRGSEDRFGYLVPWFGFAENIYKRGDIAVVYDIESGKEFYAKRTYGSNHADCEPLTAEDTRIMKEIYGDKWSWTRRPIIVSVNGRMMAASMAGMPHAGLDNQPGGAQVAGRSGGYGTGANLDDVKDNDMDGHFDIHFLGSRTHGTNRVDENHQEAVHKANEYTQSFGR